jgi:hypothetical protein
MRKLVIAGDLALHIDDTRLVSFRTSVDTDKPCQGLLCHSRFSPFCDNMRAVTTPADPRTGAHLSRPAGRVAASQRGGMGAGLRRLVARNR